MGAERSQYEQPDGTYNECVCQIKSGPMLCAPMEIKEIHYRAYTYPIYYIAHRAADNSDVSDGIKTSMHAPLEKKNKARTHKQS